MTVGLERNVVPVLAEEEFALASIQLFLTNIINCIIEAFLIMCGSVGNAC